MKILITGATGFIGKHLYQHLKDRHELHVLVRPSSNFTTLSSAKTVVFDGDIDGLTDYLKENKIDGIIHLASKYLSNHKSSEIADLLQSNIYLGTALLEAAKKAGISWFLNTGTIWQNYQSADKSDEYNPVNLYAATKQAFITVAKYYTETSPIRFCTLKLCDTYGAGDTRRKIISLFEENTQNGKVLEMSPGEQKMDLLHINDVVRGFERLMQMMADPNTPLLSEYVLSSGYQYSLRDLACMYERAYNVKLNIHWGARPYREREVMIPYIGNILPGWETEYVFPGILIKKQNPKLD